MFDRIKKMQQFSDCADEAAVLARIADLCNKTEATDTIKAENESLKARLQEIERKQKDAENASIAAEVDAAIKDGRIDETKREHYIKMLHSSEAESARAILKDLKPKRLVKDILDDGSVVESGAWAKRQEEIRNNYNN